MSYRLTRGSPIIRLSDGASIPADSGNADFQKYEMWKAAGNVPEPADNAQVQIPTIVSLCQARLALYQSGLLKTVDDTINSMAGEDGDKARIKWASAGMVERSDPLVVYMAGQLNLSSDNLDQLFMLAATL